MSAHEITVNIYGTDFTLRTGDDPEQLKALASEVTRAMQQVAEQSGIMQAQKVATLTALHMAGELETLRAERDDMESRMEALIERLLPSLTEAENADA